MLKSLYRTLFTYTIFRRYFTGIFIVLLGAVSILEISFFYADIFELHKSADPTLFVKIFFALKWLLIFGFSIYFIYSFYTFKPQKEKIKEIIEKEKKTTSKTEAQPLTAKTEATLQRLLHKKKLQSKAEKIIKG
jgi:hypothetical protein